MVGPDESPLPASSRARWGRSRVIFLGVSGVLLLVVLALSREVLLPFVLAGILAYVLAPAVALCERWRIPRVAAILLVYCVTLGVGYAGVAAIAPRIYREAISLSREAPTMARQIATRWGPAVEHRLNAILGRFDPPGPPPERQPAARVQPRPDGGFNIELGSGFDIVQEGRQRWRITPHDEASASFSVSQLMSDGIDESFKYAQRNALDLIRFGHSVISKVSRGVFLSFMILMVAGYLMHTREKIMAFFRSLPPVHARVSFDDLIWRMDRGLSGVVRGQLLICLVNGVLSAIGFAMFGLKYWPLLAIVAGVMSIVPIFGSILSTIPAVLVGLTQDLWTAIWVLLWIVGIHQLEANFLNPKIIGVVAKLHPVLVVFALLVGEHYFGMWGALLAVPALSIAQSVFNHFRFLSMPDVPRDSLPPPV